jgi:hypothetical protein
MDHDELVIPHSEALKTLEASTKSAHLRIDAILSIADSLQKLVIDFNKLVSTVEQQGKDITKIVDSLTKHDDRMNVLEDRMETKDTVQKLQDRIITLEQKDGKEALKMINQVKWLIISTIICGILALVWSIVSK